MSQPISIIKQTASGFNEFGQVSESRESYIKVDTSFRRGPLAFFSGAQLKVFFCIALSEADDEPGVSLTTIMHDCSLSKPTVIECLRFLSDKTHPFIRGAGKESDGTRRWRVCSFAWVGGKKILPPQKKFLHHDDDESAPDSTEKHHHHDCAKIFSDAGFEGANIHVLSETVPLENARAWAEWIASAPEKVRNPHGYAYACLKADPQARPPVTAKRGAWYDKYSDLVNR